MRPSPFLLIPLLATAMGGMAATAMADETPWEARAREARILPKNRVDLVGEAELIRGGDRVSGDHLVWDGNQQEALAEGNVKAHTAEGLSVETDRAELKLDSMTGTVGAGHWQIEDGSGSRGEMGGATIESRNRLSLSDTSWTTCPPEHSDWALHASRLDLDTTTHQGAAEHASLRARNIPVFYFPWIRFPLGDERQSGFLAPRVGYSDNLGVELGLPYYLNLAPNLDATATPVLYTDRGLMLEGELRALQRRSTSLIQARVMPNDAVTGTTRAAGHIEHQATPATGWSLSVSATAVSDETWLGDFGTSLAEISRSTLPLEGAVAWSNQDFGMSLRLAGYQVVDPSVPEADRPWMRLPEWRGYGRWQGPQNARGKITAEVTGEIVNFEREGDGGTARINVRPSARWTHSQSAGYLVTEIAAHHIQYLSGGSSMSATAPIVSVDGGLFFDRPLQITGTEGSQTLEPRLYYLFVPERDQDRHPVFDTAEPDFDFPSLFRTNRFLGGDRIGDAHQITAALTTRLIDHGAATERLRASFGAIRYFRDRTVNTPPGTTTTASSELLGELVAWLPSNWHLRPALRYDPDAAHFSRASAYLQHQPGADRILNFGYRYQRDVADETDFSFGWPIGDAWSTRGRWMYDFRADRTVEAAAGLDYRSCCWSARIGVAQRFVNNTRDLALKFEISLNGLSRLREPAESPFRLGLFGYERGER